MLLLLRVLVGGRLLGRARLQVALKVFQERDLLLELLRELVELILGQDVLFFTLTDGFPLVIEETASFFLRYYLSRIIEKDAGRMLGEQVA